MTSPRKRLHRRGSSALVTTLGVCVASAFATAQTPQPRNSAAPGTPGRVPAVKPIPPAPTAPSAKSAMLNAHQFEEFDVLVKYYLTRSFLPGATLHVERGGEKLERAYGRVVHDASAPAVSQDTVFDVASLTKVIATAPAIMLLVEAGKIDLDAAVTRYLPECKAGTASVRQLLTHTSGLPAGIPAEPAWQGKEAAYAKACETAPTHPAGSFFRYSDINFILLGALVEKASGETLDAFVAKRLWQPLGMTSTFFTPLRHPVEKARIAPTQRRLAADELVGQPGGQAHTAPSIHLDLKPGETLQGVVHDPTARRMGGVAGHAGVFSTSADIARFARMILADGELDGVRVLKKDSVAAMTKVQSSDASYWRRGLGFDIDSPFSRPRGALLPVGSFGHTGFTGCILWIDPFSKTFYIFLSNRVYPADQASILTLYSQLGNTVARTVANFDFQNVAGAMQARPPI